MPTFPGETKQGSALALYFSSHTINKHPFVLNLAPHFHIILFFVGDPAVSPNIELKVLSSVPKHNLPYGENMGDR
jgi:hypothetical protein